MKHVKYDVHMTHHTVYTISDMLERRNDLQDRVRGTGERKHRARPRDVAISLTEAQACHVERRLCLANGSDATCNMLYAMQ